VSASVASSLAGSSMAVIALTDGSGAEATMPETTGGGEV
jgi:hypothetical protein